MKKLAAIILLLLLAVACREKSHEKDHGHNPEAPDAVGEVSDNQELYNEVMKIHDEVMPRLDDIHRRKEQLKDKIANTPDMPAAQRQAIDSAIVRLDNAHEGMMSWMRNFSPIADSEGEDKARAYLEGEMEKVKKVRADILEALENAEKN